MGYLSISHEGNMTPPWCHHWDDVCNAAAAELTPHKLALFKFAIPLPLFNNHYERSFLPTSIIFHAHNLAPRLSLLGSLQNVRAHDQLHVYTHPGT